MLCMVVIRNFQSHEDTVIRFRPGVNVLVGASDVGKTGVLRAVRWVLQNKPAGDSIRSKWGGDTEVTIYYSDGTVVTRRKSKKENCYVLNKIILNAVGQGVPDAVQKATRNHDLNWQGQLDAPFLLSQTGGEVARLLNETVDLTIIDTALGNAQSGIREVHQGLASATATETSLGAQLKDLGRVRELEKPCRLLRESQQTQRELQVDCETLLNLISDLEDSQSAIERAEPIETVGNRRITRIQGQYKVLQALEIEVSELDRQIRVLELHQTKQDENEDLLKELEAQWHKLMPEECPLCGRSD